MKRLAAGLFLAAVLPACAIAQQEYKGTISLIPKGPDFNAAYYTNKLSMKVDAGGTAVLTANLKFGPRTEPGDYIAFTGSVTGTFDGAELSLNGPLNQAMQDGKRYEEASVHTRVSGQKEGDVITGTFYMRYGGKDESTMTFTLRPSEQVPELLFPLGKSPKVFDRGWLFGASFIITGKDNEEIDLSDQVQWSGSGSFEPDRGAASRPVFNSPGENKIILTVEHEGKKYSREYQVSSVSASQYARVGSLAKCPADAHGCMADPFVVVGPVLTGNANVLINGLPAACEGDRGRHAVCAGTNTFTITGGDDEVLINGKRAAKINSETTHCGGMGSIISLVSGSTEDFMALSTDARFTDPGGKSLPLSGKPPAGTKMVTGKNGLVLMSPDRHTVMMILPEVEAFITQNDGSALTLTLEKGQLFINGEEGDHKKLQIETFNEKLERKGTRFLFTHSQDSSCLIVYEGIVEVTLKKDNSRFTVPAGKVYFNDFKNPYRIQDTLTFQSAARLMDIPKDSTWWQVSLQQETVAIPAAGQPDRFTELVKKYWYIAGGALVLIILMATLGRKKKP